LDTSKATTYIAWYGTFTGILGNIIVTSHAPTIWIKAAMLIWLTSNLAWIYYGVKTKAQHLVVLQIGYTILSVWGFLRW